MFLLILVMLAGACSSRSAQGPQPIGTLVEKAPLLTHFECKEKEIRIDLLDAIGALPDDTLEAQREQLRDWVWTVILGKLAGQSSVDDVFEGVVDQPIDRDDALAHVLTMPVGPARAAAMKSGDVVVMVEGASEPVMAAVAAEAIDQEALYLGVMPRRAMVFRYDIDRESAQARVCGVGRIERTTLESNTHGFRKEHIKSVTDLERFLSGGVDLLSAECTESGLAVTGRTRPRSARAGVTAEHVAAIARTPGKRYIPPERFGKSTATLSGEQHANIKKIASELDDLYEHQPQSKAAIDAAPPEVREAFRALMVWKRDSPRVPSADMVLSYQLQRDFSKRPGFSLDPTTPTAAAVRALDEAIAALSSPDSLAGLLRSYGYEKESSNIVARAREGGATLLAKVRDALRRSRELILSSKESVIEGILLGSGPARSPDEEIASSLKQYIYKRASHQCARYDGPLAGTVTGMTLFYTDLLAKLWALDWQGVAPEDSIEGFLSIIHQTGSTAACGEEELPNTRIWFGVREDNYTRSTSSVRFAPIATRIFAKGSKPGGGEGEVEPGTGSLQFIRWWDRHYAAVADWEPQYETLNQIMKWSVVAQNAAIADKTSCLTFLDAIEPSSDQRFDRWAKSTSELRWHGPVQIKPEASKLTECIPLLTSRKFHRCGYAGELSGGVGAATWEQVAAKPLRVATTPHGLGRLGIEAKPTSVSPGRVEFGKLNRSGGELSSATIEGRPGLVKFRAEVSTNVSQRGSIAIWNGDTPVRQVERTVEVGAKDLVAKQRKNDLLTSELRAYDIHQSSVRLDVKSGVKEEAQRIARHIAYSDGSLEDAATLVSSSHEVYVLSDGSLAVRFAEDGGKGYYAVMRSGGGNRGPPGEIAGFVVGAADGGPHRGGGSLSSRNIRVRVSIVPEGLGKQYVSERSGKLVTSQRETLAAIDAKLKNSDVEGARRAFEAQPTPEAGARVLRYAIERGDNPTIDHMINRAIKHNASVTEVRALRGEVARARALRRRANQDTVKLDNIDLKLAICERRLVMEGFREERILAAAAGDMTWYAPVDYPTDAGLPPSVHPYNKPPPPDRRYVSRLIEESYTFGDPARIDLGDMSFERRHKGSSKGGSSGAGAQGSPYRLIAAAGAGGVGLVIVLACQDDDEGQDTKRKDEAKKDEAKKDGLARLPPCREQMSKEEREDMRRAVAACDKDGDGAISSQAEAVCVKAELTKLAKARGANTHP